MSDALVHARDLAKSYRMGQRAVRALNGVSLDIGEGEFVALMGPSGSGKTTLLDCVGCLDRIDSGRLLLFGEDVSDAKEGDLVAARRGQIGFVFQDFLLLRELTALENVQVPQLFARRGTDRERSMAALERVGLEGRVDHRPTQLSGGECQRVAIARALAMEPRLLLADEPTGNLDSRNSEQIYDLFRTLNGESGLTIVVATHDEGLGAKADRTVRLRDGVVVGD